MSGMSSFKRVQKWLTFARQWHLLDATWQDPERLGEKVARYLRGMHKPIFHHTSDCGDHVIVYNCKHIALKGFDWKRREYYFDNRYQRGQATIPAFEIHRLDPCRIVFMEVYHALGGPHNLNTRKRNVERLHLIQDEKIPELLLANVSDQMEQVMRVPKRYNEYSEEEKRSFPALFDLPEDMDDVELKESKIRFDEK